MAYILTLDQGTTSSRAILFDAAGSVCGMAQKEFPQIFPRSGWVEHDPEAIWTSQQDVARKVMADAGCTAADIAAVGITNQRETTLIWDRDSGRPLCNAIVWQDRRTAGTCDRFRADGLTEMIQERTGLLLDAYFSASKIRWMLENVDGARKLAKAGRLAFGTVDSWLVWHLTGGQCHFTDVTNASRTLLYNIFEDRWDPRLLELFDVPESLLPDVRPSSHVYAETIPSILGGSIPIAGIGGDQQAALFGQVCNEPGMVKNTYGTGSFILMYTGGNAVPSTSNLLTTAACRTGDRPEFALEGSIFNTGAVVQWLRDGLEMIASAGDIEILAREVPDSGGVYLVPAFTGLGAPHWDPYARGAIVGMTRGTTRAHIARAALDCIAHQTADVIDAMQADAGIPVRELRVDGGASVNDLLMQTQADLLGVPVVRPRVTETTALGAAYLAGLAVGFWKDPADIAAQWQVDRRYDPEMDPARARDYRIRWKKAVERAKDWEERE